MNISVFGLGYVGATSAACFADMGHHVIGVDVNQERIDAINNGKTPIPIEKLGNLIKKQKNEGRLYATYSYSKAILNSNISFICIQTPSKENGDVDLKPLISACKHVGETLKLKEDYHEVVIRSTVFPGTYEILQKEIEKASNKKCGEGFGLCLNPEFLREQTAVEDFFNPCYIVIGSNRKEDSYKAINCYVGIQALKYLVSPDEAQMIKYVNNTWHACKISFTNEVGRICEKIGMSGDNLMELFCKDKILNISNKYHKIGNSFSGHCLPKDLSVLQYRAKKFRIKIPLIDAISTSNNVQKRRDKNE